MGPTRKKSGKAWLGFTWKGFAGEGLCQGKPSHTGFSTLTSAGTGSSGAWKRKVLKEGDLGDYQAGTHTLICRFSSLLGYSIDGGIAQWFKSLLSKWEDLVWILRVPLQLDPRVPG